MVYTDKRRLKNGKDVKPPFEESMFTYKPICKWELAIWHRGEEDFVVGYGRNSLWDGYEFAMWEPPPDIQPSDTFEYWGIIEDHIITIGDDIEPHMLAEIAKLN